MWTKEQAGAGGAGWRGIVAALFFGVVCALPAGAFAQELSPDECRFERWVQGWRGQVECFALSVPERRADPETRHIDLAIYRLNQRGDGPPAPPVIYLAGGPGVAGSYYVNLLLRHPLREERPILILEQRGVGNSGELCPSVRRNYYRRVTPRRDNRMRVRQFIGLMHACFDQIGRDGGDIDGYVTSEIAADVADLRRALGLEQIDLWAVSYGTVLAQAYMRLEPEHTGAVVFDAAVPVDYPLERSLTQNFRRVLEAGWQDCLAATDCEEGTPSYSERLDRVIAEYNNRPLRMLGFSPEPSIVVNTVYVTGTDAAGIVFSLLYDDPSFDSIDRVLRFLERGSSSFLRAYYQRLVSPGFSYGMHYAVNCRGPDVTPEELESLRAEDPLLFDAMQVGLQNELCRTAELSIPNAIENDPVTHDGRVLVMAGALDPITPLEVAAPLRERFPNAGFLEIPDAGHGPSRTVPCAAEIVRAYFANPDGPVRDICANRQVP